MIYQFNNTELNTENFLLKVEGIETPVEPQVFNLIVFLLENNNKIVSRDELLAQLWKGRHVSDTTINNNIKSARKVLGDDGTRQQVIKTIHSRGYQFIATYKIVEKAPSNSATTNKTRTGSITYFWPIAILLIMTIGTWVVNQNSTPKTPPQALDNTIAVLAFKDLSPDSDQAYLAEGLSEELLNLFTHFPGLHVASRTSSFSFKNKNVRLKNIGAELNVNHVMEGSVRKLGDQLRITVQLIRVKDESLIWSETYDHDLQDIFKVQDEIAKAVTAQLKVKLKKGLVKSNPSDSAAYVLYLQAIYLLKTNTEESIKKALRLIENSIKIDPDYAPAWTVYSRILYTTVIYSYKNKSNHALILAKQAVTKALEVDPYYAKAYGQMVLINLLEWDMQAAQKNIDKAKSLDSKNSEITGIAAYHQQLSGQLAKNVKTLEDAITLDPLNDIHYLNLGIVYLMLNRLDEAYAVIGKYEFFRPKAVSLHAIKSHILLAMGKNKAALNEAKKEVNEYWKLNTLAFATYANGDLVHADSLLNQMIDVYGANLPAHIASLYAFRNDADNAFKWLEISYQQNDPGLIHAINFQTLRNLWSDPRWNVFIKKIGLQKDHWLLERRLSG